MAGEVEVHAFAEIVRAEQRLEHAHDLGALLVDGRGVEIVDLVIERGPHRMSERAGVLDELVGAQAAHIADALDRARALVGAELLITKDREAFLEAELEPVAAGDAVAGPIVEIFVRDDRLDRIVVAVGCRLRRGQHVFVVEDVEALVLHGAHVEVGHRHDHENVEIVFAAEHGFVPAHGALERVHGVGAAVLLARLDIDTKRDVAPRHGAEAVLDAGERAAHQREQIGRLGKRIVPDGEMAAGARQVACFGHIAVGEQHRRVGFVGLDAGGVDSHHVGTVGEIGDAAKTFGLALGAIDPTRAIEAHQLRVGGWVDLGLDLEPERPRRRLRDGQAVRGGDVLFCRQGGAVEQKRFEHEPVAVEHERRRRAAVRARLEPERGTYPRGLGVERNVEFHGLDQPVRRAIILQADGPSLFSAHILTLS